MVALVSAAASMPDAHSRAARMPATSIGATFITGACTGGGAGIAASAISCVFGLP